MPGDSSSSSSDDDDDGERASFASTPAVGQPFMRFQGAYLSNLLKLLNEAADLRIEHAVRWHTKISNALQINWRALHDDFDAVHTVLVRYKISRGTNRAVCVRPTMNRKLREWCFTMVADGTPWVTYVYNSDQFCRHGLHSTDPLPASRRRRGI